MKLLFAHSFYFSFDPKQVEVGEPYPPLGTLIAAACARDAGHQVSLFDSSFMTDEKRSFEQALIESNAEAVILFDDNFHWLTKMCLARMRLAATHMIKIACERNIPVVVAGSDASDEPQAYLNSGASCIIRGEAEFRLLQVLEAWENKQETPDIAGVVTADQAVATSPPRGQRDQSRFPQAAWDLVDIDSYRRVWHQRHKPFSLNMTTTRGCPYRCNWCAKPIHGRRYDVRDARDCAEEIAYLKQEIGAQHIWFTDDIFGLKPGWVAAFADAINELDAVLPFKIQARADMIDAKFASQLKRAGCQTVWLGVESGSQKILDAMHKDLKVDQAIRAAQFLKAESIEVGFFLQFGYPGEQASDIQATWKLVSTARPDAIGISVSYPLPGTPFYEKVKGDLVGDDHWSSSGFMRPLHKATYPTEFYPVLFHYFHERFNMLTQHFFTKRGLKTWLKHRLTRRRIKRFAIDGVPFP